MSLEQDIMNYKHQKQTERARIVLATRPAKESKFVREMRRKIAQEIKEVIR